MSSIRHNFALALADADPKVLSWWRVLCALAVLNVGIWLAVWHFGPIGGVHGGLQLALSGVYVLVCAYRSVLPRVDLERLGVVEPVWQPLALGLLLREGVPVAVEV